MTKSLEERLGAHPALKARVESMLEIVEAQLGELDNANDAEERVIDELHHLGSEILDDWATNKEEQLVTQARQDDPQLKIHSKKN